MSGKGSRLRRVSRVMAGGLVGGAVVLLDRRRRRREPPGGAGQRGSDPLAAFTEAPCYREEPGSKSG
jgi:hypothetical protein